MTTAADRREAAALRNADASFSNAAVLAPNAQPEAGAEEAETETAAPRSIALNSAIAAPESLALPSDLTALPTPRGFEDNAATAAPPSRTRQQAAREDDAPSDGPQFTNERDYIVWSVNAFVNACVKSEYDLARTVEGLQALDIPTEQGSRYTYRSRRAIAGLTVADGGDRTVCYVGVRGEDLNAFARGLHIGLVRSGIDTADLEETADRAVWRFTEGALSGGFMVATWLDTETGQRFVIARLVSPVLR